MKSLFYFLIIAFISLTSASNAQRYEVQGYAWSLAGFENTFAPTPYEACKITAREQAHDNTGTLFIRSVNGIDVLYCSQIDHNNNLREYVVFFECMYTEYGSWRPNQKFHLGQLPIDPDYACYQGQITSSDEDSQCRMGGVTAIGGGSTPNPISVNSRAKRFTETDWISPIEPRFAIERSIRSDSRIAGQFGSAWSFGLDGSISHGDADLYQHAVLPGSRRVVFSGNGSAGPVLSPDRTLTLTQTSPTERQIRHRSGQTYYFEQNPAELLNVPEFVLSRISWRDGYSLQLQRDANGFITIISDNRGNNASISWSDFGEDTKLISHISISHMSSGGVVDIHYEHVPVDDYINYEYVNSSQFTGAVETAVEPVHLSAVNVSPAMGFQNNSETRRSYEYAYWPGGVSAIFAGSGWDIEQVAGVEYDSSPTALGFFPTALSSYLGTPSDRFDEYIVAEGVTNDEVAVTNPLGLTTTYHLENIAGSQRVVGIDGEAAPNCLATTQALDYTPNPGGAEGYIYQRTHRNGAVTQYTRDAEGRILTRVDDANGPNPQLTSYEWDSDLGLPLRVTTPSLETTFVYNANGMLLSRTQTDVLFDSPDFGSYRTWEYAYQTLPNGLTVLSSIDGPGSPMEGVNDVTHFQHDVYGRITAITDPAGLTTRVHEFSVAGQPAILILPDESGVHLEYDSLGRIVRSTQKTGSAIDAVVELSYDHRGRLTSLVDELGKTWTFEYDFADRLIRRTDPLNASEEFAYDAMGNLTSRNLIGPTGGAPSFTENREFDALGRLFRSLGVEGQEWTASYDVEDNLTVLQDAIGHSVGRTYDGMNRTVSVEDQEFNITRLDHDAGNRLAEFEDARGLSTMFRYNGFGDLVYEDSPDRGQRHYRYDSRGLLTNMTDGRGVETVYTYDDAGRLISQSYPSEPQLDQTFIYDVEYGNALPETGNGRLTRFIDDSGVSSWFYSNTHGQISAERKNIQGNSYFNHYQWLEDGSLRQLIYPSGRRVLYLYDDAGNIRVIRHRLRLSDGTFTPWESIISNAEYAPMGPLVSMTFGDGLDYQAEYDRSYRLVSQTDGTTDPVRQTQLTWTTRNELETVSSAFSIDTFSYTPRGMLSSASLSNGETTLDYGYDAVGNRTFRNEMDLYGASTSQNLFYDGLSNRLTSLVEDGVVQRSYTYDGAGNVTGEQRPDGYYEYRYDAAGRMSELYIDAALRAEYVYNALGQQVIRRLHDAGTVREIVSIHDQLGRRIAEYQDGALIREYIWMHDRPVAVIENGGIFYIRTDHIGRPVLATESVGGVIHVVWEARYLPFGGVEIVTGASSSHTDIRFPGQWFQSEHGLHQNWMRDYDPVTGRYLQADPLGLVDGASVYGYALQNPMSYTDPRGERVWQLHPGYWVGVGIGHGINAYRASRAAAAIAGAAAISEGVNEMVGQGDRPQSTPIPLPNTVTGQQCSVDDCHPLYVRIAARIALLKRRYHEYQEDALGLPESGRFSRAGHRQAFYNAQRGLRRMLTEADSRGCTQYEGDAWFWATRQI